MPGMSNSYNLPSGMMEALGDYKAALKSTKEELKQVEKEARQASKKGLDLSDKERRLSALRQQRSSLEEAVRQSKGGGRGRNLSPFAGNQTELRKQGMGDGISIQEFATLQGFMRAGRGVAQRGLTTIQDLVAKRYNKHIMSDFDQTITSKYSDLAYGGKGFTYKVGDMMTPQQRAMHHVAIFRKNRANRKIRAINDFISGKSIKNLLNRRIISAKNTGLAGKVFGSSTLGSIGGAATVGVAAGYAIKTAMETIADRRRMEGESKVGTESMILDFVRSTGTGSGGVMDIGASAIVARARMQGEQADRLRYAQRTAAGKIWEDIFGRSASAIKHQDKMIEDSIKRQKYVHKYGDAVYNLVSAQWIEKNQRTKMREEMRKELNFINYGLSTYGQWAGLFNDDEFYDFTNAVTLGLAGEDVNDARFKAQMEIANQNIAGRDRRIKELQNAWNDTASVNYALQRIDAHERQTAITAFEKDRLTRGLTW